MLAAARALALLALPLYSVNARSINWYLSAGNTEGNARLIATHGDVIQGAYLCCNFVSFTSNGTFLPPPPSAAADIAVLTGAAVEAWAVGGVAEAAVHSGAWAAGLDAAAAAAAVLLRQGLMGILIDYEPVSNYSDAHAQAYGDFLGALSAAIAPLRVGMDIAGWGLLSAKFWPHYQGRGVSRFTSMTPTYDATNVSANEAFVGQALAALPPGSYAAGIGSVLAGGKACEWDYKWTNDSLAPFVGFLGGSGVEFIDVWRCDIDAPYGKAAPDATAPFFLDALRAFVA